jgi:O-antigen ligase
VTVLAAPRVLRGTSSARAPRGLVPTVLGGLAIVIVAPVLLSSVGGPGASAEEYVSSAANLTGRTTAWPIYLELWRGSPWTGTGADGIYAAIYDGVLPAWATHAHNLVLDALTRYGLLVGALAVAVLVIAAVATTPAARRGRPLGLAIVALTVVAGLGHTTIGWVYPEVPLLALVLAVLASASSPDGPVGPIGAVSPVRQAGPG